MTGYLTSALALVNYCFQHLTTLYDIKIHILRFFTINYVFQRQKPKDGNYRHTLAVSVTRQTHDYLFHSQKCSQPPDKLSSEQKLRGGNLPRLWPVARQDYPLVLQQLSHTLDKSFQALSLQNQLIQGHNKKTPHVCSSLLMPQNLLPLLTCLFKFQPLPLQVHSFCTYSQGVKHNTSLVVHNILIASQQQD